MAKRRDAFGSPFDEERTFTTAWGEYDPNQSSAWGSDGYTPDWAQPYEVPTSTGREVPKKRQQHTAPVNPQTPAKNFPELKDWTPPWGKNWSEKAPPPRIVMAGAAFFGGFLGIHRIALGDIKTALIIIAIDILSGFELAWATAIWGFVDAYKYMKMSDEEFDHYCYEIEQKASKKRGSP